MHPTSMEPVRRPTMTTRVAINGFVRIGRQAFKIALETPELEIVAINELGDLSNMAYLLKYDTVHGRDLENIQTSEGKLTVEGKEFPWLSIADPSQLPWRD